MELRSSFDAVLGGDAPLSEMDACLWQNLADAAASKEHPWNEGFVSTIAIDDSGSAFPKSRTVILRKADRSTLSIDFHTDARSAKIDQIANQNVCWLFYVAATKIQLRLEGTASVIDGVQADQAWVETPERSRAAYLSLATPGKVSLDPQPPDTSDRMVSMAESERGREHFRIVRTVVQSADWLYLNPNGHLRANLIYRDPEACDCHWVVP